MIGLIIYPLENILRYNFKVFLYFSLTPNLLRVLILFDRW